MTEALYVSAFLLVAPDANQSLVVAGVLLFRGLTYVGPIVLGAVALLVWRFRSSWRRPAAPEPIGATGVGAVMVDSEPPPDGDEPG